MRRLLNGQILEIGSKFKPFLNKLQLIAELYPNILCTETEWQTIKEESALGQVGKFVLNYDENGENVISVRLPAIVNVQGLADLQYLGDKLDEALPNITGTVYCSSHSLAVGLGNSSDNSALYTDGSSKGASIAGNSGSDWNKDLSINASRCSSAYKNNAHVQQEAIQYPYYIQVNLTEYNHMIDVGQIQDMLNRIINMEKHCVIESWSNGTEWYRVYADGWCEQGGFCVMTATVTTITFKKPFRDTNYTILGIKARGNETNSRTVNFSNLTLNTVNVSIPYQNGLATDYNVSWEAKGYIAL